MSVLCVISLVDSVSARLFLCVKGKMYMPKVKAVIMDEQGLKRAVKRIAHQIAEKNGGVDNVCIVGIKRRGIPIAQMLCEYINEIEGAKPPCGSIDIKFYRDDLSRISDLPASGADKPDFDVNDKTVILVDDVMYTGRTVRAAIEGIFSCGRPKKIQLAVLIDRGHRELPLRADYVGKNVPTSRSEIIAVQIPPYDDKCCVLLCGDGQKK